MPMPLVAGNRQRQAFIALSLVERERSDIGLAVGLKVLGCEDLTPWVFVVSWKR